MDMDVHFPEAPLRKRTETLDEFNTLPSHVFPLNTGRTADGEMVIGGAPVSEVTEKYGTSVFICHGGI